MLRTSPDFLGGFLVRYGTRSLARRAGCHEAFRRSVCASVGRWVTSPHAPRSLRLHEPGAEAFCQAGACRSTSAGAVVLPHIFFRKLKLNTGLVWFFQERACAFRTISTLSFWMFVQRLFWSSLVPLLTILIGITNSTTAKCAKRSICTLSCHTCHLHG